MRIHPFVATLVLSNLILGLGVARADDTPPALSWLAGHWCGGSGDEQIEEFWMSPHGDVQLGVSRTLKADRTTGFEFMRIALVDSVPTYIAQVGGDKPVSFKRSAGGENWVRFENPAHDFPTRVEYRRNGDALHAHIAGPGKDGKEVVIPFDYTRCKPAGTR